MGDRDQVNATVCACAAVLIAASLAATTTIVAQTVRFSTGVELVKVNALVTERGRPVLNLKADDFELRDNGVRQQLMSVEIERTPLTVALAVDNSSSVAGKQLEQLVAASRELLRYIKDDDRVRVMGFSHIIRRQDMPSVLTSPDALKMQAAGSTGLHDAIHTALLLAKSDDARALALVFTDGSDNSSWLTADDLLATIRRTPTVLYAVTLPASERFKPNDTTLRTLAEATGGRLLVARASDDIGARFRQVLDEFRQRYVLVYTPQGVSPGGRHTLDVTVRRKGASVRARSGYDVR